MARRSSPSRGSSSAFGRGRSPSPTATRRAAPPPPPPPPAKSVAPHAAPASQVAQPAMAAPGGGMMANIATTAAGVAIGHTMGHALTGALGMGGGNHQPEPVAQADSQPQQVQPQHYGQQPLAGQDPCKFELEQFISCAQNQSSDLSLCDGFNAVLRECKARYGSNQMYQMN